MGKYSFFNNWVYHNYLDRSNQSNTTSLAIDLGDFLKETNFQHFHFDEIHSQKWSALLDGTFINGEERIPKYFGLVALQCYAALLMENDEHNSERVYQERFCELAGLSGSGLLQARFSEEKMGQKVQELIWISAKKHFSDLGYPIILPACRAGIGRYVQFPLSQVVLNKEDLKEFIPLFRGLQELSDNIGFNDFVRFFRTQKVRYIPVLKRLRNKKDDLSELERKIKMKQIFDFYCSDWENAFIIGKRIRKPVRFADCIAVVSQNTVSLYDYLHYPIDITNIDLHNYGLFRKSEYDGEYDLYRNLEYDIEYLICCRIDAIHPKNSEELKFVDVRFRFFRKTFSKGDDVSYLKLNIFEPFPLKLNGLKINRKGHFLKGYGPFIDDGGKDLKFTVYFGNQRLLTFDPIDCEVGEYKLKLAGYRDISFTISDFCGNNQLIGNDNFGWALDSNTFTNSGPRINGFLITIEGGASKPDTIRAWINNNKTNNLYAKKNTLMARIVRYEQNGSK